MYFTNSDKSNNLPKFSHFDDVGDYGRGAKRYMLVVRYMSICWPEKNNLKWVFMVDDDAAVSGRRVAAYLKHVADTHGSPTSRSYFLGKRYTWTVPYPKWGYPFFGGNGVALSKAFLDLIAEKSTAEDWQPYIDDGGYYEFKLGDFLEKIGVLDTDLVYPGTGGMLPFGIGDGRYCDWYFFCDEVHVTIEDRLGGEDKMTLAELGKRSSESVWRSLHSPHEENGSRLFPQFTARLHLYDKVTNQIIFDRET